jgi:Histidine kinase-, DNA gyrase B-, and HSP90-like ATPase
MESFLDRLLAEPTGTVAAPRAPAREGREGDATTGGGGGQRTGGAPGSPVAAAVSRSAETPLGPAAPRIAVYDTLTSPPRVVSVEESDLPALIASLAEKTYHSCREQGGQVPYTVISELIENLIHAYFRDVVITILDGGQVIRVSDHGPGVEDKERAFLPGFTTASAEQRAFIKGVGSGLPIARESLSFLRGVITVEDNLGGGAVFTINLPHGAGAPVPEPTAQPRVKLTNRQKKVLVLLMELGSAGPSALARELGVAPATAFRDLGLLEEERLIYSVGDGKRALTEDGIDLLDGIL